MSGTYSSSDWDAIGSMLAGYFACVAIFVVALIALMIVVYWKILQKAGYNGAWSLLVLVPGIGGFASLGILLVLAFGDWPVLRAQRGAYPPPPVRYPTNPPPGGPGYAPPPGQAPAGYTPPVYVPPTAPAAPPQGQGMAPGMSPVAPPSRAAAPPAGSPVAPGPGMTPPAPTPEPPAEPPASVMPEPLPSVMPEPLAPEAPMPESPASEPPVMELGDVDVPMSPESPDEPANPSV